MKTFCLTRFLWQNGKIKRKVDGEFLLNRVFKLCIEKKDKDFGFFGLFDKNKPK
jgi:hypothetical protein